MRAVTAAARLVTICPHSSTAQSAQRPGKANGAHGARYLPPPSNSPWSSTMPRRTEKCTTNSSAASALSRGTGSSKPGAGLYNWSRGSRRNDHLSSCKKADCWRGTPDNAFRVAKAEAQPRIVAHRRRRWRWLCAGTGVSPHLTACFSGICGARAAFKNAERLRMARD